MTTYCIYAVGSTKMERIDMYIVELQKGVWLAPRKGDPGRTLVIASARVFDSKRGAQIALGMARRFRPFANARIIPLTSSS